MPPAVRIRAAVVLPVALLLSTVPAVEAARQDVGPVIRVASISPFVDAQRNLRVVVQVTNTSEVSIESASMRVSIHPRIFSRSQLRESIDIGIVSGPRESFTQSLATPLGPGAGAVLTVERLAAEVASFSQTGVYPVQIVVDLEGAETVYRTAIPYLATAPETRINVTWLLPLTTPTALRGDGGYHTGVLGDTDLPLIRQQMRSLAARAGLPVTLVPEGSFVDALVDLSDGFQAHGGDAVERQDATSPIASEAAATLATLREAASVVGEIASTSYTEADLSALALHGLESDLVRQLTTSRRAIEEHLGRTPTFRFLVPPGFRLGRAEAETLSTLGVENVLLDQAILPAAPETPSAFSGLRYDLFGVSRPALVRSGPQRFGALIPDPALSARLAGEEQSVLLAQALIAETASSWLEIPLFADDRLLVLAAPRMPQPPALAAALDGLAAAPWVQMRTASDALGILPPEGPAAGLPRARPPDEPFLAAARQARDALATLEAISIEPHQRATELDRMILLAESARWRDDPSTGIALARAATQVVNDLTSSIRVAANRTVTLTSRTGALPVTVINDSGLPVRVRVTIESPKAIFPEGAVRTIDLSGQATLDFAVETLAAGAFPVTVTVATPDGTRQLARGRIVLRSTAVSAVALAAIGGGALFLIIGSLRRRRRNGRSPSGTAARG